MKEFDELLNEVLYEDVNLDPPLGIERRMVSALSLDRTRLYGNRKVWREALAAGVLLGLAGLWELTRSQRMVAVVPKVGSVVAPRSTADSNISLPLPSQGFQGVPKGRALISENPPRRQLQRETPRLAQLEIEPLVIKPIEIASLTSRTSTGKGEER